MKYSLVIFDFDGTLCDNRLDAINSIQSTYKRLGKAPPSDEVIGAALTQGLINTHLFKRLTPEIDALTESQLISDYKRASLDFTNKQTILFPGVKELLAQLEQDNIPCVIVSNRGHLDLEQAITVVKLGNYITRFFGVSDKSRFFKPDPHLYEQVIKPDFADIDPNKILVVGDTVTDLHFAKAIGADACWVSYGHGDPKACQALSPEHIVNEVKALNDILAIDYRPSQHFSR